MRVDKRGGSKDNQLQERQPRINADGHGFKKRGLRRQNSELRRNLDANFKVFGLCRSVARKYISICIHTNVVIYESRFFK